MPRSKSDSTSYLELENSFRQKQFSPLYLFYGEEDLLIDQAVDLLIAQVLDESAKSFNLDIVSDENADAKDIVSFVSAFPMMSDHRVVVVRNLDKFADKELLLPIIENPVVSTVAVFVAAKADYRLKVFKALQTNGVVVEFKQLYENEIPGWISKRIDKLGRTVTAEACVLIQSHVGRSLREIQNEIDKLLTYIGEKQTIEAEDVTAVVGMSRRYNIFELQKTIGSRDLARSLDILEHILNAGESPVGIIVMLTKYFQKLWMIWDLIERKISREDLIKALHLSPRQMAFLDEEIRIARSFPGKAIERCFAALIESDEKLKSSDMDEKLLMTLLLYNLVKSSFKTVAP